MSSKNKPTNEEAIKQFFEEKVNQSGHTFEEQVEKKLQDNDFWLFDEEVYLDKDEGKGRTIDFIAHDLIPARKDTKFKSTSLLGQLRLVIECKSLPDHAWVFFGQGNHFSEDPLLATYSKEMDIALTSVKGVSYIQDIYFASRYSEYIYTNKKRVRSNKKENNLYESIMAVIKATRHNMEHVESLIRQILIASSRNPKIEQRLLFSYFQPLIIFNGRMYKAIEVKDAWKLEKIDMVQIKNSYVSKNYLEDTGVINIVTYDVLDGYLKKIKDHFWKFEGDFIKNRNLYENIIKDFLKSESSKKFSSSTL